MKCSGIRFKGYVHYASKDKPQYIIKSDKTDPGTFLL